MQGELFKEKNTTNHDNSSTAHPESSALSGPPEGFLIVGRLQGEPYPHPPSWLFHLATKRPDPPAAPTSLEGEGEELQLPSVV